jgi:cobalt/nickel transport system ATP-binding protein
MGPMTQCHGNAAAVMECLGVCYAYEEGSLALKEIDLTIHQGEFVALLASNGSGKTTLIKVMAGLLKPQKGYVRINGHPIHKLSPKVLYQQVGLVLQNPKDQLFGATVADDVAFGPRNLGLPEDEIQNRVVQSLEQVGAGGFAQRAIHHLSFGEQKRVALAGVLAMRPSILLLDEATAGLDPAGETQMMLLLNRLNRELGITVIFATHLVDMLPLFADRVCVLDRGQVLRCEAVGDIFRDYAMLEKSGLRMPYVTSLFHDMKRLDRVPVSGLPLTVREARAELLSLIPEELLMKIDSRNAT